MKNKDKILIIIAFCIVILLCYGLYSKYETFRTKIGTGHVDMMFNSFQGGRYYCNNGPENDRGNWVGKQDKLDSLKFDVYDDGTLIPIEDNSENSCYKHDNPQNLTYSLEQNGTFNFGDNHVGMLDIGKELILDDPLTTQPLTTQPLTTQPLTTQPLTTQPLTTQPLTTQPLTTQPLTTQPLTTQPLTTQPLTTQPLTTQPLTTQPLTTLATTTTSHNNTQYLKNIQNKIDNGYSMLNNNRFTIMDNQLKLDSLNSRTNKLFDNINKLNNFSNQNKIQTNELTFY